MSLFWIGQTLNSSEPRIAEAMATGERRWLESVALRQARAGMHAIDVHAGTFGDDEVTILRAILPWIESASGLPICIDSASMETLLALSRERHRPPILNSIHLGVDWPHDLSRLAAKGCDVVVQLRRGSRLPDDREERIAWTEEALLRAEATGLPRERLLLDQVLLPWGDDLQAGKGLLDYLTAVKDRWPELRTLVGLSNVSYGHDGRGELHRLWLRELASRGLTAALVDPFDVQLLRSLP